MSNSNVNKITILNISGKRKDRREFLLSLYKNNFVVDYTDKDLSNNSSRQIVRKIKSCEYLDYLFPKDISSIMVFENLNSIVIQDVGDELDNMIIDIHLDKLNKCIKNEQIKSCLELLEKL